MESREDLERDLVVAFKNLTSAAGKSGQGAENKYGEAFQRLVRNGHRPQLRKKYRTQKG
jgi:hypothetical protein